MNPIKSVIRAYAEDPTGIDSHVEMKIFVDLPFVPPLRSFIVVVEHGDYFEVVDIHINIFRPAVLDIRTKFQTPLPTVEALIKEGWEHDG